MRLLWSDSAVIAIFLLQWSSLDAFLTTNDRPIDIRCRPARAFAAATTARASVTASSSVLPDDVGTSSSASLAIKPTIPIGSLIRKEGGLFSFKTKYGALNPYAIFYGLFSILLGIPWFIALTFCQLMYKITNNRWDPQRRAPVALSQLWGTLLTFFTYCYPKIENRQILVDFLKEKRPAMFVANHSSWMDIPYLGLAIGWRNYKIISKQELVRVPILGKAITVGGNITLDRKDRKSQLLTLKKGIQYLNDGVHLCTFPEGTRTRTGRVIPFKNGAFKMAHKAGAPIIPISICNAHKVQPPHWMFPFRPSRPIVRVVINKPIESKGKTEEELTEEVRQALIAGLPEDQHPLENE